MAREESAGEAHRRGRVRPGKVHAPDDVVERAVLLQQHDEVLDLVLVWRGYHRLNSRSSIGLIQMLLQILEIWMLHTTQMESE